MTRGALAVLVVGVIALVGAVPAAAAAPSFCDELGGRWDGSYCRTTVESERAAERHIKMAIPDELIDNPATAPAIRDYLSALMNNWRSVGAKMVADSYGEENFQIFRRGDVLSAVFRETYHADGPDFNNAYRTFTFDMAAGRQLRLADLIRPGLDPLTAIPPLADPFLVTALDQASPPHQPGTYPFVADRWTPDKLYSGGYRAWAVSGDELILYLPDYPVAHDAPLDYTPGHMQWSMDGGTVQVHIPLVALTTVLRPEFGGA